MTSQGRVPNEAEAAVRLFTLLPAFAARVQPVYQLLDWTWTVKRDRFGKKLNVAPYVPSVRDIVSALVEMLDELLTDPHIDGYGGGGLWVNREDTLVARFEITEHADHDEAVPELRVH